MARFFIDRPVFAWVIAIVIMLAGLLSLRILPIAQYPNIAPPTIRITAQYPGASAQTVENSVTQVIEQNMKGIDNLNYFSANSDSNGQVQVTLTFANGTNPDTAQVQVQNKLQLATPLLPQIVQQQGITVTKASSGFLLVAGFVSKDGSMDATDLGDFVASSLQDPLSRVPGVGELQLFGAQYAMRIWMDPGKLNQYQMMPSDVTAAIQAQNAQVSAGQLGALPAVQGQGLNATVTAQNRLQNVQQFENIVLRVNADGSTVKLRDVARVAIGSERYSSTSEFNGSPSAALAVSLATGANALDVADAFKARIRELSPSFPAGVEVVYPYDTTPFVKLSIEGVVHTLIEAVVLVFCVMYLFLQNFRATLIPTIAVPVVLLGTFGVMAAAGFSINTLTMFGMVLAIGLLVDDAIVVVENVERVMAEEHLPPKEATRKSMDEITGALIGIALVLSAVFVPMAFFGGSVGVIYRQFSITIVSAMALSVLVALTLTPALCATMLKPHKPGAGPKKGIAGLFGFFAWFNKWFDRSSSGYQRGVRGIIRRPVRFFAIYLVMLAVTGYMFTRLPSSFVPEEDQGFLIGLVQTPVGATMERTDKVLDQVLAYFQDKESATVESVLSVKGFSFAGAGQNMGLAFIKLKDWDERKAPDMSARAIAQRAMGGLSGIKDGMVFVVAPPPIQGLGNATGFDMYLQDRSGAGHAALIAARNELLGKAAQNPALAGVRPNGQEDTPQFEIVVDQERAGSMGLSMSDINTTLSTAWGGTYVNDFIDRGRVKKVYVQGDAPFRMQPDQIADWYVRTKDGTMVPFSAFADTRWTYGSPRLERYNGTSAVNIQGSAAPGVSSGTAMTAMDQLVASLPQGFGSEWTGLSYQERLSGSQAPALYAISILVVFLCLAALYESWSVPFSVLLVVPLGVFGALIAASHYGLSNDVYFQVGLLTTIGLAAKNAILIVEFAIEQIEKGESLIEGTLIAARQRLRPIIMTSLAFVLGVVPLAISTGAGSGSQNAIGIGVIGGVLSATILGILLVPLFFVAVRKLVHRRKPEAPAEKGGEAPHGAAQPTH